MEDKHSHIDSFLENKFEGFEPKINPKSWEKILHGMHPIDLSLSVHLNESKLDPPSESKKAIFSAVENSSHPIDSSLYHNLSKLEKASHSKFADIPISRNKRSYRVLWLFAILLLFSASGLMLYQRYNTKIQAENSQSSQTYSLNKTSKSRTDLNSSEQLILKPKTGENKRELKQIDQSNSLQKTLNSASISHSSNSSNRFIREEKASTDDDSPVPFEFAEESITKYTPVEGIPYFAIETFELRNDSAIQPKKKEKSSRYKISPLGIGMSIGYLSENNRNTSLTNENAHKDALGNFNNSSASTKSGINLSILLDYNIGNRIQLNTGVQYSYSQSTSNFNYIYSQIPIYDTTGSLLGYFKRPTSQSPQFNEPIESSSRLISIPIQALYRINSGYKYSIHLGAGLDWTLKNTMQTKIFNFENESIEDKSSSQNNGIQAKLILQLKYKIRSNWNMHFNMMSAYRKQNIHAGNTRYDWGVISPSFNLGFTYNPIFKLK
ncbi:MAG: outer membrane beta-barrel protein [Bacteroidia bacterium]